MCGVVETTVEENTQVRITSKSNSLLWLLPLVFRFLDRVDGSLE